MNKKIYYIGLDVHKESVAIAYIQSNSRAAVTHHRTCGGSNIADPTSPTDHDRKNPFALHNPEPGQQPVAFMLR